MHVDVATVDGSDKASDDDKAVGAAGTGSEPPEEGESNRHTGPPPVVLRNGLQGVAAPEIGADNELAAMQRDAANDAAEAAVNRNARALEAAAEAEQRGSLSLPTAVIGAD